MCFILYHIVIHANALRGPMIGEINNRAIYMYHKKINDVNCLLLRCPLLKEGGVQTKNKNKSPPSKIKYFNVKRVIVVQHLISLQQSNISLTSARGCCSNWIISLSNEFYVSLHFMLRYCLKCLYVLILLTIKLTYSFFANMYRDRIFLIYTCLTFIDWLPSLFYVDAGKPVYYVHCRNWPS